MIFSVGWVQRFRDRYGVTFMKLHGEAASAPEGEVARAREIIDDILRRYDPNLIYNMDEAGLFWQMEPDKTLVTANEVNVRGVKKQK